MKKSIWWSLMMGVLIIVVLGLSALLGVALGTLAFMYPWVGFPLYFGVLLVIVTALIHNGQDR